MNIHDFKTKWGTEGWRLLIEAFIKRAPSFPGDLELAGKIGEMVSDLESALESENNSEDRKRVFERNATRAETFAECAEYCENIRLGLPDMARQAYKDAGEHFRSEEKKCR